MGIKIDKMVKVVETSRDNAFSLIEKVLKDKKQGLLRPDIQLLPFESKVESKVNIFNNTVSVNLARMAKSLPEANEEISKVVALCIYLNEMRRMGVLLPSGEIRDKNTGRHNDLDSKIYNTLLFGGFPNVIKTLYAVERDSSLDRTKPLADVVIERLFNGLGIMDSVKNSMELHRYFKESYTTDSGRVDLLRVGDSPIETLYVPSVVLAKTLKNGNDIIKTAAEMFDTPDQIVEDLRAVEWDQIVAKSKSALELKIRNENSFSFYQ